MRRWMFWRGMRLQMTPHLRLGIFSGLAVRRLSVLSVILCVGRSFMSGGCVDVMS